MVKNTTALLMVMLALVGACRAKGRRPMRAENQESIEHVGKEIGLTFPAGTKLIGVHRERGADDMIAVKVEMPVAA